jgi:hypothetical protein
MFYNQIRKFYNIDAPETPSTPTANIASLMATGGVLLKEGSSGELPDVLNKEVQNEPPTVTEPQSVEPTTEIPNAAQASNETPTATPEPVTATPAPIEQEPAPVQTWQEVLRNQQPKAEEVLQDLGYDANAISLAKKLQENPKMLGFFNHWETNGDVSAYLRELNTDYSKMPAEEVMRHQLRKDYPKAPEAAINALYEEEIVERYKLDPDRFTEAEVERGRLLLEAKADRYRDEFVTNQEKFLIPKPPEPKPEVVDNSAAERQQQEIENYKRTINSNAYTQNIITNKSMTIGDGPEKFNYPISDPQALLDTLFDDGKWQETQFDIVRNSDGSLKSATPKIEHQLLVALVARDGKAFLDAYANHFKSIGGRSTIEPIENAKPPVNETPTMSTPPPASAAEAMARSGRVVSGGY